VISNTFSSYSNVDQGLAQPQYGTGFTSPKVSSPLAQDKLQSQKSLAASYQGISKQPSIERGILSQSVRSTESVREVPIREVSQESQLFESVNSRYSGTSPILVQDNYTSVNNEEIKKLQEKVRSSEKTIQELGDDKKQLSREAESLKQKVREQEEMLFTLSQQRNTMKAELENLKSATMKLGNVSKTVDNELKHNYQLWQMILVAIAALILGAFLSSA